MSTLRGFHGPNAGYVLEQHERFRRDPSSVEPGWRDFFEGFSPDAETGTGTEQVAGAVPPVDIARVLGAHELAESIRARGHTAARLDPLGSEPVPDAALRAETHGLSDDDLRALAGGVVRGPLADQFGDACEGIQALREIYSGAIGYEFDHIQNAEEREWFRDQIESGSFRAPPAHEKKRAILRRLSQVEGFEKYLHKTYFGQKRFSIEGNDALVPLLDEIIERAGAAGAQEVVIGMSHRGRLNVLAHVLGKPYAKILPGFQGGDVGSVDLEPADLTGDVKYHMGWRGSHRDGDVEVIVSLAPNPSHLEFVNPVVIGIARAAQDETNGPGAPTLDVRRALPILVHGDAAFPGQGVVAETLNMSCLGGFTVGGTVHVIVNNQIGFTTDPAESRSTRYASDLAKGFEVPIVHVNADDVEACLAIGRLAQAYRDRFHKDFLIDLIGYRRWGHNEGDEPLFTQPEMYQQIREHPTVRELWAARLVEEQVVGPDEADAMVQEVFDELDRVRESLGTAGATVEEPSRNGRDGLPEQTTAVAAERLTELNDALLKWPEGFQPNPRLAKQLERRREAVEPDGAIDWGHAETLAFATILTDGIPVRMTGQDVERGTFSHRHQVLHDTENGDTFSPLASLPAAKASFEIHNSPLTEMAVVGFEYGYSVGDPEVLVLWEAQFGDFVNGSQVIIDQFLASSYVKWQQTSGLVMLLPHGYEGQGPEHSSARLERFLQLAAQGNVRVVNCTTSAQYFHLLRRQALLLQHDSRPLIVMSPKSLLRHPMAASRIEELTEGEFRPVIGDPDAADRADQITRLLLCSGKVYVDLMSSDSRGTAEHVALARVEELYPFPADRLRAEVERYPAIQEIVWVQEEPKNMGAWAFVEPRLRELANGAFQVRYEGRPFRASPAEGYATKHAAEQGRIVRAAWEGASAPQLARAAKRA